MIEVRYPGKLYIMGEYNVMEPHHSAIVMAVNRYLTVRITSSKKLKIQSAYGIINESTKGQMKHVEGALAVSRAYLEKENLDFMPFDMIIESELDAQNKKKYGFGSSGVVIVAVLDSILKFHGITLNKLKLFKLAVYTQTVIGDVSSGGELACSIYGGLIYYRRYLELPSSLDDVDSVWDDLEIKSLNRNFHIEVGYTHQAFNSKSFLDKVSLKKKREPELYQALLKKAEQIVLAFLDSQDITLITQYRNWMVKFGLWADIEIETDVLKLLIDSANNQGYPGKVSGAGGGDCGIALSDKLIDLTEVWKPLNIERIDDIL